jgi:hypothetical protein
MFSNGPKIITTGLSLLADASDQLSYPGAGNAWTDLITGTTASLSGSISFTTDYLGSLVTANSTSVIIFPPSTANFGSETFTVEFAFRPTQINGQHWILSKNSGSFPNWGVYLTGSAGSGRLVAFFNISSTISCSLVSPTASITTGSNYIVDASLIPSTGISRLYINSETVATGSANGVGSLSATSPLFFSNINPGSNSGTVNSVFNIKTYTPRLNLGSVRQNYNALGNRLGLSSKAWIAPVTDLLLDFYPGAAAAYSLRQLSSDYGGYAIRVRNSLDQELDIGFNSSGELDTVTLLNHCGGGNGFVKTWYDQSGNGKDATQPTAANQPQIVNIGFIIQQNSKPSLKFDGVNDFLQSPNTVVVNGLSNLHFYTVTQTVDTVINSEQKCIYHFSENGSWGQVFLALTTNLINARFGTSEVGNNLSQSITSSTSLRLLTTYKNSTTDFIDVNNTNVLTAAGKLSTIANTDSFFKLGKGTTLFANSYISEFIFYSTNQTSNNLAINTNINDFYSIY